MNTFRNVPLKDICKVISGYAFKSESFKTGGNTPVIKIKNIKIGTASLEDAGYVDSSFLNRVDKKYKVLGDDILISLTGSHMTQPNSVVGRVGRYPSKYPVALLNQRAGKIIPNKELVNKTYLFYALLGDDVRSEIAQMAHGAASQANVSPSQVESVEIPLPDLELQRKIGSVLQNYDILIENNNRRIAILEDMAQSLYREWFVNFRYPGHKDNHDADGNPKLVDSPLGLIPEGWAIVEIGSIAKVKGGKRLPKGKKVLDSKTNYPYLRVKDFSDTGIDRADIKYIDEESHLATKRYVISSKDIYISIAGTIGRVGVVPSDLDGANLTENAAKICELTEQFYQYYLLRYLRSFTGKKNVQSRASGSSQPKLALYKITEIPIVIPTKQILEKFHKNSYSLNKQIEVFDRANLNLKKQRDTLLPKLISGKIKL